MSLSIEPALEVYDAHTLGKILTSDGLGDVIVRIVDCRSHLTGPQVILLLCEEAVVQLVMQLVL